MNVKVSKQGRREARAQKILLGCGVLGGVLGGTWAVLQDLEVVIPRPLLALVALAVIAVVGWGSIIYWRNVDEAAREAHKSAWLWGGTGGTVLMLPILALTDTAKLEALFGPGDASHWVVIGLMSLFALQIAGYGLVWAGWWLMRQR
jgi:hypothetical protein